MTEEDRCTSLMMRKLEHYLLQYRNHLNLRLVLLDKLRMLNVQPTTQNLLGGGHFPEHKNKLIITFK